jgi:hypothetical protein
MPVVRAGVQWQGAHRTRREVKRLLELLTDAVDGEGRLVFLGGEAGVGKTVLDVRRRGGSAGWSRGSLGSR